jgi:hypothetical protein
MFERCDLGDRGVDRCGRGWVVDGAIVHVEHDHRGCSGTFGEALLEQVDAACDSTPGTRKSSTASPPATRFNPTRPSTATTQATRTADGGQRSNDPIGTTRSTRHTSCDEHTCSHCIFAITALFDSVRSWPNRPDDENETSVSADEDSRTSRSNCSNAKASTRRRSSRSRVKRAGTPDVLLVLRDQGRPRPGRLQRTPRTHPHRARATPRQRTGLGRTTRIVRHGRRRLRVRTRPDPPTVHDHGEPTHPCSPEASSSKPDGNRRSPDVSPHDSARRPTTPHHACSQQRRSPSCAPLCSTGSRRRTPPHCQHWSRAASTNSPAASARTEAAASAPNDEFDLGEPGEGVEVDRRVHAVGGGAVHPEGEHHRPVEGW